MPKKSSSKTDIKSKALYKAASLLPTTTTNLKLPATYVKALPMIIGVITVLVILITPTTRNYFFERTDVLKNQMALSIQSGVSAYVSQIKSNINILPIDSQLESKNYLGRVETPNIKEIKADSFAEKTHLMTASLSQAIQSLK